MAMGIEGEKSETEKYFKAKFLNLQTMDPFEDTRINFRIFEPSHVDFMYGLFIFLWTVTFIGFLSLSVGAT